MKYILEKNDNHWNVVEENDNNDKKIIAIVFEKAVARIICRELNKYIERIGKQ